MNAVLFAVAAVDCLAVSRTAKPRDERINCSQNILSVGVLCAIQQMNVMMVAAVMDDASGSCMRNGSGNEITGKWNSILNAIFNRICR